MEYRNPRIVADFPDWPSGAHRVACRFNIEKHEKRGYRAVRTTQDRNGKWCRPKTATYGGKAVIAEGEDGRTYIVQLVPHYGFIKVMRHDFMDAETVFRDSSPDRYAALLALIDHGWAENVQPADIELLNDLGLLSPAELARDRAALATPGQWIGVSSDEIAGQ